MLKLFGTLLIISGTVGAVYSWNLKQDARLHRMELLIRFAENARYRMEVEKLPVPIMLQRFLNAQKNEQVLLDTFGEILQEMPDNRYQSAVELWNSVLGKHKKEWNLSEEEWECFIDMGRGIFGYHLQENLEILSASQKQLSMQKQREYTKWKEKQRVVMPIGILAGFLLVIILL